MWMIFLCAGKSMAELKAELKAASYDVNPYPGTFRSGRARWMATFMNAERKVIARRIGMELQSKHSGSNYKVFSRQEWVDPAGPPPWKVMRRENTSDADALALLRSVYAEA